MDGLLMSTFIGIYAYSPAHSRIVPIIGSGFFSAGVLGTFMPITTYLIDAYQLYAASALAANTVLRSLTGALLPLAGPKMVCALFASTNF
jgi:fluoride ion exporter CrcB/FEX